MKLSLIALTLLATLGFAGCNKPEVIAVPVPVPGPAGSAGATGETGATGGTGATGDSGVAVIVVAPPASSASLPAN